MTTHDALKPIRSAWHRKYRRAPIPKAGRIVVMWAHVASDGPGIYTCRGDGVPSCDGHLMNDVFCGARLYTDYKPDQGTIFVRGKSIVEELIARGYDITTLRFTCDKLPKATR
jgi:hypothetical protein